MILDLKDKRVVIFRNIIYLFIAIFVAGGLLEGSLRLFWPQAYKLTNIADNPSVKIMHELGYSCRPNARWVIQKPEYTVEYHTNDYGMRDKGEHVIPKPPRTTRVLILGDSFAIGAGNEYEDIWPVIFEQKLVEEGYRVDVVKAAMFVNDTEHSVAYLEKLFPAFRPDIVVISLHSNDILLDNPIEEGDFSQLLNKEGDFVLIDEQDKELHSIVLLKRILKINDFLFSKWNMMRGWKKIFVADNDFREQSIKSTEKILLRAKKYVDKRRAHLVVLSLPDYAQVIMKAHGLSFDNVSPAVNDDELSVFALKNDFVWLPTLPQLTDNYVKERQDLYFRLDGHLNKKGNRVIGEYLSDKVVENFRDKLYKHKTK